MNSHDYGQWKGGCKECMCTFSFLGERLKKSFEIFLQHGISTVLQPQISAPHAVPDDIACCKSWSNYFHIYEKFKSVMAVVELHGESNEIQ